MRSLGSIRARVERLASAWPTSPNTTFISWISPDTRCPFCNCDLEAHAQAAALAEAVKGRDPRELPPRVVFFAIDELTTCPRCGAMLQS
jgi:rubredoxin